jgi:hypothetical protein
VFLHVRAFLPLVPLKLHPCNLDHIQRGLTSAFTRRREGAKRRSRRSGATRGYSACSQAARLDLATCAMRLDYQLRCSAGQPKVHTPTAAPDWPALHATADPKAHHRRPRSSAGQRENTCTGGSASRPALRTTANDTCAAMVCDAERNH